MRVDFAQGNLVEAFVRKRKSKDGWLDDIDRLVDWRRLEASAYNLKTAMVLVRLRAIGGDVCPMIGKKDEKP